MPIKNRMQEKEKDPSEEKILILPLGEESKKITQVISNDTARQIIELLADAPLSASDIAGRLQVPLTTITYNLENLESVGLIKVERIKYSEKGREVKIYAPVRKLIVVVPERTDRKSVADIVRKYLGVILAAVLASSLIEFFMRSAGRSTKMIQTADKLAEAPFLTPAIPPMPEITPMPAAVLNETARGAEGITPTITPIPPSEVQSIPTAIPTPVTTATPTPLPPSMLESGASKAAPDILTRTADTIIAHPGILFLLGCLFAVTLLVFLDYRRKKKNG